MHQLPVTATGQDWTCKLTCSSREGISANMLKHVESCVCIPVANFHAEQIDVFLEV